MSAISTTGAHIDRWDNGCPAHPEEARLIEALKLERSSRYLCSEGFITFISKPHDDDTALILAPYSLHQTRGVGTDRCLTCLRKKPDAYGISKDLRLTIEDLMRRAQRGDTNGHLAGFSGLIHRNRSRSSVTK